MSRPFYRINVSKACMGNDLLLLQESVSCTRKCLTLVNTTAIAHHQNHAAPGNFSPICNSSCIVFTNVRKLRV